ncbi:hypothetical protein K466DRAFT_579533 [Polyporus arcularius HHB13444]|uniref:Uncharacterized protein n=1 Tax=Polyporus arcularius HHB13444 TaxID=1314778 RepID=A0A5C3PYV7_9APHY|nr:hypothetical protein K466DRAFT_579533 [Polyporus arcularius HHB13444]
MSASSCAGGGDSDLVCRAAPTAESVSVRSRTTGASAEAVAAEDVEDDVEDRDDDRYDDADDDHDDARNGRDNGVDGAANGREDSTHGDGCWSEESG